MPVYSHTKLSTFENCPLQYKLKYIDKLKVETEENIEAFLGKRVHGALEKLYKDLRYSKLLTPDEVINFYNNEWDKNWNDTVVISKKEYSAQNYKDTGIRCLKNYYNRYSPFNQATTIGIEEKLMFSISGDGNYKIQGYIDRLDRIKDGVYEIHDYKTSGSLPLQEYLDEDRQLALYEIGLREKFHDAKEVKLIWHYLTFDTEMASKRTTEQLSDLRKETIALIDAIERKIENNEDFKHKEGNHCEWCDYWEYCPAKRHLIKVDALSPEQYLLDDGVALVNKYTNAWKKWKEAEAQVDKFKTILREYAKTNGVQKIKGSDHTVKVTFDEKFVFPEKSEAERIELEKLIKDAGLWDVVSELDKNSLSKIIKAKKWDKELLEIIKKFVNIEERATVDMPRVMKKEE
jgi:putative RecB family exonuclease